MASIIWDDVLGIAPTDPVLIAYPELGQILVLAIVNGAGISAENFGGEDAPLTKAARCFLAAHIATMASRKGMGLLSSQTEGGASQSYVYPWLNPRALMLTSYGLVLYGLISGTPARAGVVVG